MINNPEKDLLPHELAVYNYLHALYDFDYSGIGLGDWLAAYEIAVAMGKSPINQSHTRLIIKIIKMMGNPRIVARRGSGLVFYLKKKN